jgi:hypothetical protein
MQLARIASIALGLIDVLHEAAAEPPCSRGSDSDHAEPVYGKQSFRDIRSLARSALTFTASRVAGVPR